ncbi:MULTISPECIES: ABC transporter substrate-binding protein [Streptomyces]|uniref:nSTAND3 domain-containing NTPase n=1 Tax=Streptomyces lycopersici TaxID=2974589 RepID=UPI0021D0A024|nr:ABC transporter substrate-binding protein [Streptomyces sp. NEAU-383]
MREATGTYVHESRGTTHTGDGDQYIYYLNAASARVGARGKDSHTIAQDQLDNLSRRFVAPKGFAQARNLLLQHGSVLLSGPPGSGRRTAALMLLHQLPGGSSGVHELDTEDEAPFLDTSAVREDDRILMDLSDTEEIHYSAVQGELSGFRSEVQRRGSRLVIVLPQEVDQSRRAEFLPFIATIEQPEANDLLMRHLRVDGIHPALADLALPKLAQYVAKSGAGELARLADLIRRARDDGEPTGSFAQWTRKALAALTNRGREVAARVASLEDGRQRALLLSLAMFHESTPGTVFRGATSLLKVVGHPDHESPRLNHADLTRQFTEIGATTGPEDRVRFGTWAYDSAVRTHFWTYFPDLRDAFRHWVRDCVYWLDQDTRNALIQRFAEQVLRTDRPDDLWWLAERWTEPGSSGNLLPDATQALAEGLRHDRYGQVFRRKIYESSLVTDLPRWRRHALITVCSKVMAVRHPDQALVRLHHLARREGEASKRRAQEELLSLARGDSRLFRLLLERITLEHYPADAEIFLALAEFAARTRALYISMSVRNLLTRGWAAVLRTCPRLTWKEPVESWLHAANATATHGGALLDVLVDACEQRSEAYSGLYVISRNWAATSAAERSRRDALAQHFAQKIDAAQGIAMEETTA